MTVAPTSCDTPACMSVERTVGVMVGMWEVLGVREK